MDEIKAILPNGVEPDAYMCAALKEDGKGVHVYIGNDADLEYTFFLFHELTKALFASCLKSLPREKVAALFDTTLTHAVQSAINGGEGNA